MPSLLDVLPDVELGPVRDGEHADVLALAVLAVVEAPQLRPLVLGVPLTELVAEGVDALLGPRLLLVAAAAAEHGVELVLDDGVEQRRGLQAVAAGARTLLLDHAAVVDALLHGGHDELHAELGDAAVAELDDLGEVVAGVDVHHRERDAAGPEGLLREAEHDDRVLAAGEQQDRTLELGRHLPHDEDGLVLELVEMGALRRGHQLPRGAGGATSVMAAATASNTASASSGRQMRRSGSQGFGWL